MLKYIKIAILVFACIKVIPVKGQVSTSKFPSEEIIIQTSQQLLFPGEILWFSVFSTNSLPETDLSTLAFVELINSNNISVLRKKVKLSNGCGNSYFQLPDSINTGVYSILAYTNWMKNFDTKTFFCSEISIINPKHPFKPNNAAKGITNKPETTLLIKSYNTRERIYIADLIALSKPMKGGFTVSVKRKEPKLFIPFECISSTTKNGDGTVNYLPDYKGIVVSGKLYHANNEPAGGEELLLSFPGNGADLLSSISDANGKFSFHLSTTSANQDLVFTLPNTEMKLKLEDPFINQQNWGGAPTIQLDSLANTFLQEKYFYWQLAQKFGNSTSESAPADSLNESLFTFYSTPNRSFKTKDYILLDSLTEYFHELIPSVKLRQSKNKYRISIIQQKGKVDLGTNPGVFVDGVYITEYNNIAKIPVDKLDRIEVLSEKYHYKDFTFDGIVSIHTKNADFYSVDLQENMTRIIYPLSDKNSIQFKSKDYTESSISSKRPDLRNLLYWNPAVSNEEFNKLYFYTSDIPGTYEISISGHEANGKWDTLRKEFEVK